MSTPDPDRRRRTAADPAAEDAGTAEGGSTARGAVAGGATAGGATPGATAGAGAAGGGAAGGGAAGAAPAGGDSAEGGADGPVDAEADAARRRGRAVRGILAAALSLEALVVLLVPLTVARVGDDGLSAVELTVLLVIAAALLIAAGLQRHRFGTLAGSALQVAVIATGVMVGAMYFLGLLFAGVWAYALWVRQEIERAAARAAAAPADGPGAPTA